MDTISAARQAVRLNMRNTRNALSKQQQDSASESLLTNLLKLDELTNAQSIAVYLSSDGEINPEPFINHCWSIGKKVFLPVLDPNNHNQLLFIHYLPETSMRLNKYKIYEPAPPYIEVLPAEELDIVLLPLVAFDQFGNRMGMGGGYYDRSFAFKKESNKHPTRPLLIGLAHKSQQLPKLSVESWDIPLEKIITDDKTFTTK